MFAISGLDIALSDLAARVQGVPVHRLIGEARRDRIPAYASLLRIGTPDLLANECRTALRQGYTAIKLHETTTAAVYAARQAIGTGVPLMVDMNCPLDGRGRDRFRTGLQGGGADVPGGAGLAAGGFRRPGGGAIQGRPECRGGRERLYRPSIQANDGRGRGQPCTALGDQGRRHHRISEDRSTCRSTRHPPCSAFPLFGPAFWRHCS